MLTTVDIWRESMKSRFNPFHIVSPKNMRLSRRPKRDKLMASPRLWCSRGASLTFLTQAFRLHCMSIYQRELPVILLSNSSQRTQHKCHFSDLPDHPQFLQSGPQTGKSRIASFGFSPSLSGLSRFVSGMLFLDLPCVESAFTSSPPL